MVVFRSKRKGMKLLGNMVGTTILSEQSKNDITDRMNKIKSLSDVNNISNDIANFLCDSLKSIREGIVKYNIEKKKMRFMSPIARFDEYDKYNSYEVENIKNTAGTIEFSILIEALDKAVCSMKTLGKFDKNDLETINNIFEEISSKKFGGFWRESVLDNRDVKNRFNKWHKELENAIDLLKKLSEKADQLIHSPRKLPIQTNSPRSDKRGINFGRGGRQYGKQVLNNVSAVLYGAAYTQSIQNYTSLQNANSENCRLNWSFTNFDENKKIS